jgi:O-antigen/teichoic acid export membrane protein
MTSRIVQLLSDTFFYSLGLVLRRGLSIITLPVLTRYLSVREFGMLSIIGTVRELLSTVFELGIPNSSARFYYDCRTPHEQQRLFGTLLVFSLIVALVGCSLLALVGAGVWSRFVADIPFHPYITLTLATILLSPIGNLSRSLFRVTNRVALYTTFGFLHGLLAAVLTIALVVVWHLGVLGAVLGTLAASLVLLPFSSAYLRSHIAWTLSPPLVWKALAFGLPEIPVRTATWALRFVDRLMLQAYLPLRVVGLYSLGYMLGGTAFELIASSVNSAILPFFYSTAAKESQTESARLFADIAAYNTALLGFLALGTILFAREVILIFATRQYLEAEPVVALVAWASVFQALANVPNRSIYLVKKTGYLPLVFVVPAMLNIGLNALLIPRYGMMGAAWATLVAYPVLFGLTLWVAQQVYPIPYDYWRMAKPLGLAFGLSLLTNIVPHESLGVSIVLKALILGAFPLGLLALGFVSADERRRLRTLGLRAWTSRRAASETRDPA